MLCRALLCEDGLYSDTSDCVYIWVCAIWGKCLKCTIDKVLDERGVVYINPRMHAFMYSLYIAGFRPQVHVSTIFTFLSYLRCLAGVHIFQELRVGRNVGTSHLSRFS